MTRGAAVVVVILLGLACLAGPAVAAGASGKVTAISGDKVTVELEKGKAAGFPVGMRDVEIKGAGGANVRGRVMAVKGDRITIKVVRGKPSSLSVGGAVNVGQAADAGAEGIDGC